MKKKQACYMEIVDGVVHRYRHEAGQEPVEVCFGCGIDCDLDLRGFDGELLCRLCHEEYKTLMREILDDQGRL